MKKTTFISLVFGVILSSCSESVKTITVKNSLSVNRTGETVLVSLGKLGVSNVKEFETLGVVGTGSNEALLSQKIDTDGDGQIDAIIFQPAVGANSKSVYKIIPVKAGKTVSRVFSRFVPERTDDYAWENDKVAFRTFGPAAQRLKEDGNPAGTLTSGIDCWLKRVDYPIINKWYKAALDTPNYYHIDRGEGLDAYHVGGSRGCGGIGVLQGDELFVSKNFTKYKTITNGPVRTCFYLDYADWDAGGKVVKEQKHISLDLGSNLTRVAEKIEGVDQITVGITLHENSGKTTVDTANNCYSYWEPLGDSELGTGIVVEPKYYNGVTKVISGTPDKSQLLVNLKVIDGEVVYYTGFGWKKSGQFENADEWNSYLKQFSKKLKTPLGVEVQ